MSLTPEQRDSFSKNGYYFPMRVLSDDAVVEFKARFIEYLAANEASLRELPSRKRYLVLSQTHTFMRWVYRLASHPAVLDSVESVLGSNLLAWDSGWFAKMPGDSTFIGWHQDGAYWNVHPPRVATAWIALTHSKVGNGCLRVIPGSHRDGPLPHQETEAKNSGLSRGQEIAVDVDESRAVDIVLRPGEMSLHDIGIVHGSKVNQSGEPRIGLAVRYTTPEVKQDAPQKPFALLVRGVDNIGNFELLDPPMQDDVPECDPLRSKVLQRLRHTVASRPR